MMLHRLIISARSSQYEHLGVSLDPVGDMRNRFEEAGVELIVFDFKHSPIAHFFQLVLLIRRVKPDIVQSWLYHADLLGGLAARMDWNNDYHVWTWRDFNRAQQKGDEGWGDWGCFLREYVCCPSI